MEYVGRKVRKECVGFGVYEGTVNSFNSQTGLYQISYRNGDSDNVQFGELASILEVEEEDLLTDTVDLRTQKRLKCGDSGNFSNNDIGTSVVANANCEKDDYLVDLNLNGEGSGVNNSKGLDLNIAVEDDDVVDCMDLDTGKSLNRAHIIDLNVNVSDDVNGETKVVGDNLDNPRKGLGFDLNFGVDNEKKESDDTQGKEFDGSFDDVNREAKVVSVMLVDPAANATGTVNEVGALGVLETNHVDESGSLQDLVMDPPNVAADACDKKVERTPKGNSRKRRKKAESVDCSAQTVLRRSARRGTPASSAQVNVPAAVCLDAVKHEPQSPEGRVVVEEKDVVLDCKESEECNNFPTKPKLPPCSDSLNLDDIPICDVFSVYSFLRSFSTLLFLSPFELGDFVASLRCKTPTLLFDYIHLSLLQILRKHLESLSDESSESASVCLRSLNWNLLDLVTWPVLMVEYLLTHHSLVSPAFDLNQLKLFESDYYKQPAFVKIEMLQCLCDDVNEVEIIRSELNKRTLATDPSMDVDRKTTFETPKKTRAVMDVSGTSWNSEVVDETADWNSDECCLCKMDGSLICCDGCPAAFHSRCVGVTTSLLPEGDWYCPECNIDKGSPLKRVEKSIRGAILLGIDPYDRLFYNSCGYLLVSDSDDIEFPFRYYHVNDFTAVLEAIKSSHIFYNTLLTAIMKYWNVSAKVTSEIGSQTVTVSIDYTRDRQMPAEPLIPRVSVPLETRLEDNTHDKGKPVDKSSVSTISGNIGCEISEPEVLDNSTNAGFQLESSGGAAESSPSIKGTRNLKNKALNRNKNAGISTDFKVLEKSIYDGTTALMSTNLDVEIEKDTQFADSGSTPSNVEVMTLGQCGTNYVNFYSFARTASLAAEALLQKASDKVSEKSRMSVEELILAQLKVLSNISIEFRWSSIHNLEVEKEKCGWCFACKYPEEGGDCLFVIKDKGSFLKKFTSELLGIHPTNEGHLIDLICHILFIEDRLRGLLLGPWLNPNYSVSWCKAISGASDIASLKHFLVTLESNLHSRALSAEWHKQVDSATTLGSASHIMSSSLRMSLKNGIGRKRSRFPDLEPKPSLKAASGLVQLWWRGGRISRGLFKWKVLPRSLVSKAARQGGSKKIPGIFYSDSSDNAKRSKCVAWRASVEASSNVQQLAIQVRELDANIRWDTFENIQLLSKMDKEFGKSVRFFKKVIIRRKCLEGTIGKYLLDFGKRRFIPDTVTKHGSMIEESSSSRKKYWLEESYVPLHLLKAFEDRRIARKITKTSSIKHQESGRVLKKFSKKASFAYLFSKAERPEYHQCGLCKKDVLIREAVHCQYCKGFFHKKHVTKSTGLVTSKFTYTCHKCQDGACAKVGKKKGRPKLQKGKTSFKGKRSVYSKGSISAQSNSSKKNSVVPLRRSTRKVKLISRQSETVGGLNKRKQTTFKKGKRPKKPIYSKKPKKAKITQKQKYTRQGVSKKKRTAVCYPYWLNGLRLSRKPNDERIMQFRREKLILASELTGVVLDRPQCSLCCETKYTSTLNYVCCEICGEWFHGDAFGLTVEKTGTLIGFRCHNCRSKAPSVCPHMHVIGADEGELDGSNAVGIRGSEEAYISPALENEQHAGTGPGSSLILNQLAECEHPLVGLEQSTEGRHDCKENNGRPPDMLIGSDENNSVEDGLLGEGGLSVTEGTLPDRVSPLVDSNVDIPDKN